MSSTAPHLGSSGGVLVYSAHRMADSGKSSVYIDGQNFLFRAASVLTQSGLIATKDDITAFDFRHLFENALGKKDRYRTPRTGLKRGWDLRSR